MTCDKGCLLSATGQVTGFLLLMTQPTKSLQLDTIGTRTTCDTGFTEDKTDLPLS